MQCQSSPNAWPQSPTPSHQLRARFRHGQLALIFRSACCCCQSREKDQLCSLQVMGLLSLGNPDEEAGIFSPVLAITGGPLCTTTPHTACRVCTGMMSFLRKTIGTTQSRAPYEVLPEISWGNGMQAQASILGPQAAGRPLGHPPLSQLQCPLQLQCLLQRQHAHKVRAGLMPTCARKLGMSCCIGICMCPHPPLACHGEG